MVCELVALSWELSFFALAPLGYTTAGEMSLAFGVGSALRCIMVERANSVSGTVAQHMGAA